MRVTRSAIVGFKCSGVFLALSVLLAIGVAGIARAAILDFTGTLDLHIATLPSVSIPGGGSAQVADNGSFHLLSLLVPDGAFGPFSTSLPLTTNVELDSVRFTSIRNLPGSLTGISGGPPSGGTMGLTGLAKLCLGFAACQYSHVPFPLAPTTGGAGFGIGGTASYPGPVALTMQHAPWTIGQPVMTLHTPNSTISRPVLPGGFAHGPASLTSSTAQPGGGLQMVTATKVFTSLTGAFPELPYYGVLHLLFPERTCSDGDDNDGDGFVDFPNDPGCDDGEDDSERSPDLVCDNGLDDDADGLVDFIDDPGCDHPTDDSEKSPLIDCDDGTDNDGDGLVDTADPGCTEPADGAETEPGLVCDDGDDNDGDGLVDTSDPGCDEPLDSFEQNCGQLISLTVNETEDAAPAASGSDRTWHPASNIAWHQWDGDDFEILLWDGSTVTSVTDNDVLQDQSPAMAGTILVWEEWGAAWRIMRWTGATAVPLSEAGVDGWDPDTDGSGVVWSQGPSRFGPPDAVYHWDGSETAQVFGSVGGTEPAISGNSIVWETGAGIHMWTGSTTVVIPGSAGGHAPAVSGTQVVWHASDGGDDEIYYWDGLVTQQLTHNATHDRNADIWGNRVVWESADGIQVRKHGATTLIAGSLGGQFPKIDGIDVVWQAPGGGGNEILLATLCVQCNDGADNDGDAKIDYDGGLSALGYVAAVADPQCTDKPWKDRERRKSSSTCGLGAELALLLPPLLWAWGRRRTRRGGTMLLALVALLAVGTAGHARASTLDFTGTLEIHLGSYPDLDIPGSGAASVSVTGTNHLDSLALPASAFGPVTTIDPLDPPTSYPSTPSLRFTGFANLSGSFTGISGGPPSGGTMGITGLAKICLLFAACEYSQIPFPLTPTPGGAGFGIGGTRTVTGGVQLTMQHAPWTIGQPLMTLHTPNSTISTPALPGGFAHGPASLTSSTAQRGGALQMVTATKVYTSLTGAFPEFPLFGVLDLTFPHPACSDGSDNDGDGFTDFPADPGCDDAEDRSEQSDALVCDNGLDDDGDGAIDVAEDPGCDHPTDASEKTSAIACDDGTDNDGDGLVDWADPGCAEPADATETNPDLLCDDGADNDGDGLVDWSDPGCDTPADPFEQNCGELIQLTDNATHDQFPVVSGADLPGHPGSRVAWQHWDGSNFEILLWDGSTVTPMTDNDSLESIFPTMAGEILAFEQGAGDYWRILVWSFPGWSVLTGQSGYWDVWSPDTDGSRVVYSRGPYRSEPPEGVYHWGREGPGTTRVPGSDGGMEPAISGDTIVWETAAGIHMWDGSTTALIPGSAGGHAPAVWWNQVVWHTSDGSDDEIHYWDGLATQQLTHNEVDDRNADISGNRIVWESAEGIRVRKDGRTSLIAGSLGGHSPKIDGIDVVWHASDGSDDEIFLTTICVQCNDGADNDGDAKIDYDGGLSALGYVAAVADPQCAGKPWKDRERRKRSSSCGLGAELAFLLPPLMWLYRRRGRAIPMGTS